MGGSWQASGGSISQADATSKLVVQRPQVGPLGSELRSNLLGRTYRELVR